MICRSAGAIALLCSVAFAAEPALEPDPTLTPDQVVEIQLAALAENDSPARDNGIRTTFQFASPSNRKVTGPVERFIVMVKNPLYLPLLDHATSEVRKLETTATVAQRHVIVTDAEGNRATFIWILSKQPDGPYKDCWMTDSVQRIEDVGPPANVARAIPEKAAA